MCETCIWNLKSGEYKTHPSWREKDFGDVKMSHKSDWFLLRTRTLYANSPSLYDLHMIPLPDKIGRRRMTIKVEQ